jgi:low temperature requirement protein LtrA
MTDAGLTVPATERRSGALELFFDLVFVYAITQLVTLVLADTTAAGFARAGLVMAMIWWAWSQYTWMTNAVDPADPVVRLVMLTAMGATLFMAQAVPEAFGPDGAWFAVPYMILRLLGLGLYWWGVRDDSHQRKALRTYLPLASIAPVLVLLGGLVATPGRTCIWVLALAVDVASTVNAGRGSFRVEPAHFAERYGLFVIIALGESIVAIGVGSTGLERTAVLALTAAACFAGVATLWWSYFGWVADAAEQRLRRASLDDQGRLARDLYTYLHLPIVAGIVLYAVAVKTTLHEPGVALPGWGRFALAAGIGLFLSGFVLGNWRATGGLLGARLAALVAVVVVAVAGAPLASGVLITATVAVLIVALVIEAVGLDAAED